MFDFITKNPLIAVFVVSVVWFLIKNHIVATPLDLEKVKSEVVEKLKEEKTFITPEELNKTSEKIKREVETRFLTLAVFNEFKNGIDNQFKAVFKRFDEGTAQFKTLFRGVDDIKNILIKK